MRYEELFDTHRVSLALCDFGQKREERRGELLPEGRGLAVNRRKRQQHTEEKRQAGCDDFAAAASAHLQSCPAQLLPQLRVRGGIVDGGKLTRLAQGLGEETADACVHVTAFFREAKAGDARPCGGRGGALRETNASQVTRRTYDVHNQVLAPAQCQAL